MNSMLSTKRIILFVLTGLLPCGSVFGYGLSDLVQTSSALGNNWYYSSWYGLFRTNHPGSAEEWIFHNEHGWIYVYGIPSTNYSTYDLTLDTVFTFNSVDYPSMWVLSTPGYWMHYTVGSAPNRWFFDESMPSGQEWVTSLVELGFTPDGPNGPIPVWWKTMGLVDLSKVPDNYAPLTVGQLKHVATRSKAYLEEQLQLTNSNWNNAYSPFGANPFPLSQGSSATNHTVANIGQLKFMASGFYRALHQHTNLNLIDFFHFRGLSTGQYGTNPPLPWPSQNTPGANQEPANLGQLKLVFGFILDLNDITPPSSGGSWSDQDFDSTDSNQDFWSDGLKEFMGLAVGGNYLSVTDMLSIPMVPSFLNANASLPSLPAGSSYGPVLMIPERGLFRVVLPNLDLRQM